VGVDFEDAVLRLERAAKQIKIFEQDVTTFLDTNPSTFEIEKNPKTGVFTLRLVVSGQPPAEWRVTLQEVIGNIRSPFDYVMVSLADANGGHNNRTAFPIYGKPKGYRDNVTAKTVNIPAAAMTIVESVQPYHGGDLKRLDVLRRLDDDGKHKRLHAATSGIVSSGLGIGTVRGTLHVIRMYGSAFKNGDPLITFTLDGEAEMHPNFSPEVVMGKGNAAQGNPMIRTLREIHETAMVVIDQFVQTFG
jgi:hypothetical protein